MNNKAVQEQTTHTHNQTASLSRSVQTGQAHAEESTDIVVRIILCMSPCGSYHGCGNLDREFNGKPVIYKQVKPKYRRPTRGAPQELFLLHERSREVTVHSTHSSPCFNINKVVSVYSHTVGSKEDREKLLFPQVKCWL